MGFGNLPTSPKRLDAFDDHQVADIRAADADCSRQLGDRLVLAAVQCDGDAHLFAVVDRQHLAGGAPPSLGRAQTGL
jgi:hypothetical protein